jgi:hypothetical protein
MHYICAITGSSSMLHWALARCRFFHSPRTIRNACAPSSPRLPHAIRTHPQSFGSVRLLCITTVVQQSSSRLSDPAALLQPQIRLQLSYESAHPAIPFSAHPCACGTPLAQHRLLRTAYPYASRRSAFPAAIMEMEGLSSVLYAPLALRYCVPRLSRAARWGRAAALFALHSSGEPCTSFGQHVELGLGPVSIARACSAVRTVALEFLCRFLFGFSVYTQA